MLNCPHCNTEVKVPNDSTEPGTTYEATCPNCNTIFGFEVEYNPSYTSFAMPCFNGGEHTWKRAYSDFECEAMSQVRGRELPKDLHQCEFCGETTVIKEPCPNLN